MSKATKEIVSAIKGASKKKTTSYDTSATVTRVEGDTVWVHIPGGVDETPAKKTINAVAGETVQVRVGGGKAWLTGNATAPPTDDKKANEALNNISGLRVSVGEVFTIAEEAGKEAGYAMASANGKNTVYHMSTAPSGGTYKIGDTWFNSSENYAMYTWNGSQWVKEEFGNAAIADLSITNAKIADATIQDAKISTLDAGKITAGTLLAARIGSASITADKLDVTDINAANKLTIGALTSATQTSVLNSTYITDVDSKKGITIKPYDSTGNDYLLINSNAIAFYRNSTSNSCLNLTDDTFRIGLLAGKHVTIDTNAMTVYIGDSGTASNNVAAFGATARIGVASAKHVRINSNGLTVWAGDENTTTNSLATFGDTSRIGKTDQNHISIGASSTDFYSGSSNLGSIGLFNGGLGITSSGTVYIKGDTGVSIYGGLSNTAAVSMSGKTAYIYGDTSVTINGGTVSITGNTSVSGNLTATGYMKADGLTTTTNTPNMWYGNGSTSLTVGRFYYNSSSSKRYKHDIKEIVNSELLPELLYKVDVKQFKYNNGYLDEDDLRNNTDVCGFIAEELHEIYPVAVDLDKDGNPENWNDRYIIPPMLALIQKQHKEIENFRYEIANLKYEIATLK